MAYGTVKVDNITFTNGGIDQTVTVSGIVQSISGNITATGTIQAATIIGTSTVSGATVTGTAGVFTTVTGGSAGFTTVTGTTVTGTTANFATLSGTTITGSVGNFGSGSAAAPSVSFGTTDNGIYSPGADQVAISTNGTGRLFVDSSGKVGVGTGGSTIQSVLHVSKNGAEGFEFIPGDSSNTNVILHYNRSGAAWATNDQWAANHIFRIQSSEVARIDSSGRLGLGTSSPSSILHAVTANDNVLTLNRSASDGQIANFLVGGNTAYSFTTTAGGIRTIDVGNADLRFRTNSNDRLSITSSGNVGVGTSSPNSILTTKGSFITVQNSSGNNVGLIGTADNVISGGSSTNLGISTGGGELLFGSGGTTERARIDSSGRLLVGTSTARGNFFNTTGLTPGIQLEGSSYQNRALGIISSDNSGPGSAAGIILARQMSGAVGGNTIVANNDSLGLLTFLGSDGTEFVEGVRIEALVDGTPGANDMPGRLVFSTTADGASSPTERMRIDSSGNVGVGTTSPLSIFDTKPSSNRHVVITSSASYADNGIVATNDAGGEIALGIGGTPIQFFTGATERARIDSSGRFGLGTSSPSYILHVNKAGDVATDVAFTNDNGTAIIGVENSSGNGILSGAGGSDLTFRAISGKGFSFGTGYSAPSMRIDSSGRVGVGTTSPGSYGKLAVFGAASNVGQNVSGFFYNPDAASSTICIQDNTSASGGGIGSVGNNLVLYSNSGANLAERARIDSSGRLLVGTSTSNSDTNSKFQIADTSSNVITASYSANNNTPGYYYFFKTRGASVGSHTVLQSGDGIANLWFAGSDGSTYRGAASIEAVADGGWSSGDAPGRLVFSTTADGASSPTERMRISSTGTTFIGKTSRNFDATGVEIAPTGGSHWVADATTCLSFNRLTNDGDLIEFGQGGFIEGTISVSGSTVSYNGAHLSRWSQLPSGAERIEILRGSVLSNIDEMCEWDDEENEQLNRMKVSDVEGDKNVSGVFQAWDDDDDTYTNDFYCAMTGDFIIRIGAGVTVERGDLLMSAGDGTAKPQDDDIIRSKTIAKVTSTIVSCTHPDGSYCVPCVLMAC